jgi:adenine-specific DNA-methyltransferase
VVKSVILNTDEGKKDLEKIFGFCPFNNAKPLSLLKNLISMINKKEMNCLDFFAGSGSFGHAILEFNEENNTSHSFVLITNNENNIFEDVTTKRFNLLKEKLSFDLEKLYLIKK